MGEEERHSRRMLHVSLYVVVGSWVGGAPVQTDYTRGPALRFCGGCAFHDGDSSVAIFFRFLSCIFTINNLFNLYVHTKKR